VVTTNRDPEGRRTVFDVLPTDLPRVITVGRLDINTEGLLLLTNDGGLARTLELPATGWLRRYRARVHGRVDEARLVELKDGIAVDGVFYGSIEATLDREQGSNAWLTIGLREGKNREVKNILGALGLEVSRLIRISFGPFQLGELPEGHVQEIKGKTLRDQLGERLVEESGANFDADIVKPFSNKPVHRDDRAPAEGPATPARTPRPLQVGEGGLVKNRRRDGERHREEMLGRLQTKPPRGRADAEGRPARSRSEAGGKPQRGKRDEREKRPIEPPGGRKTNVWMAPGARPMGTSSDKAKSATSGSDGSGGLTRKPRPHGGDKPDRNGERPGSPRRPPRKP
jgi:23S rRNA pseudouridine2605 synthase